MCQVEINRNHYVIMFFTLTYKDIYCPPKPELANRSLEQYYLSSLAIIWCSNSHSDPVVITCLVSYKACYMLFSALSIYFHRNNGWIASFTIPTATPVSIGQGLPSLCWWCWDSSVAMAASQRAGRSLVYGSVVMSWIVTHMSFTCASVVICSNYGVRLWS